MVTLIKNIEIYAPEYLGVKDILFTENKILNINDEIPVNEETFENLKVIDGSGKLLVPGFIDSHVHIIGGGGEGGFKTRVPEIMLSDIIKAGVTTIIGCLGTDGISRSLLSLLAKARALEEEGITSYIYSGSYRIPVKTITGEIEKDFLLIDKIIGVGEVAIADHRSSHPSLEEFIRLSSNARIGGILSDKAGIINVHVGPGKEMLDILFKVVENTEIPISQFLPTHTNGNKKKFEQSVRYAKLGGNIDFTTSSSEEFEVNDDSEIKCSKALYRALKAGVDIKRITFSSDAQGSLPVFSEKKEMIGLTTGKISSLFAEVKDSVLDEKIELEKALKVITSNPARIFKLNNKGKIDIGFDADLCILEKDTLEIDSVISKGQIMMISKNLIKYGTFEKPYI